MPTYSTTLFPDVQGQSYERAQIYRSLASPVQNVAADQLGDITGTQMLWLCSLGWNVLSQTNAEAILHAIEIMGGDVLGLYFFEWESKVHEDVYVGTGDGTSNPVTLPVKGGSSITLYANGSPVAGSVLAGSGTNGEDRFDPTGTITNGHELRADFTGRRRRRVRLESPEAFEMSVKPKAVPLRFIASARLIETEGSELL